MEYYDNNRTDNQETGFDEAIPVIQADSNSRIQFLVKTYLHLIGAVVAFICIESVVISMFKESLISIMQSNPRGMSIVLIILCFAGPFLGNMIINSSKSIVGHYVALAFYVLMYVCLFIPILTYALVFAPGGAAIVGQAAGVTVVLFAFLTVTVFVTGKDFSFLRAFLVFASLAAIGLIVASLIFGFQLGLIFTYFMIALACCYILYDTSNVMLHYPVQGYVIASVELFASVMMLFFYILRLFLSRDN